MCFEEHQNSAQAVTVVLPMCHREFGPATEYGCLLVSPEGDRKAELIGSSKRRVDLIRSLVTRIPLALKLPLIIDTPEKGASCLILSISDLKK